MASSEHISLGAGILRTAILGTTEPVDLTAAWGAGWEEIGYTDEGSEFSYEFTSEPVEVAESLDPLFYRTVGRNGSVSFSMAENTVRNLTVAFNGGKVTVDAMAGVTTYEPPEPGEESRRMLGFESEDGTERWIFRQVFQGGSVSIARRKGATKAVLPVEFRLEKPQTGLRPFRAIYDTAVRGGGATATA